MYSNYCEKLLYFDVLCNYIPHSKALLFVEFNHQSFHTNTFVGLSMIIYLHLIPFLCYKCGCVLKVVSWSFTGLIYSLVLFIALFLNACGVKIYFTEVRSMKRCAKTTLQHSYVCITCSV